jgi:cytochrome c nitrite reductase small subunit
MSKGLKIGAALVIIFVVVAAAGTLHIKSQVQTTDYCAGCHVIAPYYDSWKSSPYLAHTHQELGLVCQDCHTRTARAGVTELVKYTTHNYEIPLKDHRVRPEECLRCHGSYAALATRTKNLKGPEGFPLGRNPHDSHWGQIDCGICHKMHKASVDLCAGCHGFPDTKPGWGTPALNPLSK